MTSTPGQTFTDAVRSYLKIGTRTRQTHTNRNRVFEMIRDENEYPGYYGDKLGTALRGATQMTHSWDKHVEGYRIDPCFRRHIELMSMWQFTAFLGRLIDETTCVGEAEVWFQREARAIRMSHVA